MIRVLLTAAVLCLLIALAVSGIGRAIDQQVQDRVIFTRDGVTFDCERRFVEQGEVVTFEDGSSVHASEDGEVFYTDCHTLP